MLTVLVVIAGALVIMLIAAVLNRRRGRWSHDCGFELQVTHGM